MAAQYLIESIKARYDYTYGYPGFVGNYEKAGLKRHDGITESIDGKYEQLPMFYALKAIGDTLHHDAKLVEIKEKDDTTIRMVLRWIDSDDKEHISLYLINKRNAEKRESLEFDKDIGSSINVLRYSEDEMLVSISPEKIVQRDEINKKKITITMAHYSMTVVDLILE